MNHYKIYGLNISSSRKISLLKEQQPVENNDLSVNWKISTSLTPDNTYDWEEVHTETLKLYEIISLWKTENSEGSFTKVSFKLQDNHFLNFILDAGKEKLWIYHDAKISDSDLESYLVGPALGFIMRMRGMICLHSSAVEIDGKVLALVGCSTSGKSTTAAGLAEKGAKILADDIAVLTQNDNKFVVQSGYSKVRLRPIAAEHLTDKPEDLPIVYSYRDSRYVSLDEHDNFSPDPLPLEAIYVLGNVSDDYKEPQIEQINANEKILMLLANTYGSYVVMDQLRANEFKVLAKVARDIPMRKLLYAHDISTLSKQCDLIIEDFRKTVQNNQVLCENA